uniref:THAP4-like heme-binding domain-containing protein n=2 Tax=Arion vulgaris TaxID=1028688 RepID=A0A0B6Z6E5_9EUPU
MAEGSTGNQFHETLKPLSWLFGTWRSTEGKGIYPSISDFTYSEEAVFLPVGLKPVVDYKLYSWKTDTDMPMHREKGFIRIKPNTNQIAFVAAHTMGVVEVQEGEVHGQELTVETKNIGRTSFNSPPEVKVVRRTLKLIGNTLEQVVFMQTDKTELNEHLRITYKKVE